MTADARRDLLFEIGVEEVPSRFLGGLLDDLARQAAVLLEESHLPSGEMAVYGTPRRLTLYVKDLAGRQPDRVTKSRGPAAKIAFSADGQPTKAAQGFARGQGVGVEELQVQPVDGVDYVFAVKQVGGRPASELLPELLPRLVQSLNLPKAMRWGSLSLKFIRPIRWLVALYGDQVVPFQLEGIVSGRTSLGHRTLHPGEVTIATAGDYFETMRRASVIVDQAERRQLIAAGAEQLAGGVGGGARVKLDDELLDEVNNMVEWPTPFLGHFAEEYLAVPGEVLETTMKVHQRYFPVVAADGRLLPYFIGVRNGSTQHLATVVAGNEKVLRARLADARFFWDEDRKTALADKVEALSYIVFHEKLGTLLDKAERLEKLVGEISARTPGEGGQAGLAIRAAHLAKADQTTHMVYEFPELQGVMGREYALVAGEAPETATALYEQYLPRYYGDALPESFAGTVLSLADRLDSLVGFFGIGIQPTGSADPYGQRRQALGIIAILAQARVRIPLGLRELLSLAYRGYGGRLERGEEETIGAILEFIRGRLENTLREAGFTYDTVQAVLAAGYNRPADVFERCRQLTAFRGTPEFAEVYAAYGRVANIAQKAASHRYNPALFVHEAEGELHTALERVAAAAHRLRAHGDYQAAWRELATLRAPIDRLFESVMIMEKEESVKENRLALTKYLTNLFTAEADWGMLTVAGE
ncbi:MAG: glycine--tRNA ligase subunit beta [Bacillota bacterium]